MEIVSLIIAVAGGIPGVIGTVQFLRNRRRIHFVCSTRLAGHFTGSGGIEEWVLLLSGWITNPGKTPIHPISYEAKCKVRNKWVTLKPILIPPQFVFKGESQVIDIESPANKDLVRETAPLANSVPRFGHLLFIVPESAAQDIYKSEGRLLIELICVDSLERRWRARFVLPKGPLSEVVFPHLGIQVK